VRTRVNAPSVPRPLVAAVVLGVIVVVGYDAVRIGLLRLSTRDAAQTVAGEAARSFYDSRSADVALATAEKGAVDGGAAISDHSFSVAADGSVTLTLVKQTTTVVIGRVEKAWTSSSATASSTYSP